MSRSATLSASLLVALIGAASALFDQGSLGSLIKFKEMGGPVDDITRHDDHPPQHDDHPQQMDDALIATQWVMDGVLEFESTPWGCDYVVNRTTVPVGHCIKNIFTRKGAYSKVAATWPDMNNMVQIMAQGFEDPHCKKPVGRTFQGALNSGCMDGMSIRYSPRRTPHGIGLTTRVYHADACHGGHIDLWSADYQCTSGFVVNPAAKSYIVGCAYDYVYEYMMEGCMGESMMHSLSDLALHQCQSVQPPNDDDHHGKPPAHQLPPVTLERVCGGQMPVWTNYPTMMPTMPPQYTPITMPDTPYNGGFMSMWDAPQYYSFQWMGGSVAAGSGDGIYLQALTGDVRMFVFYSNMMTTGDCTPGNSCWSCYGYASSNSTGSTAVCAFDDYFNYVCGGDSGCTVKIAVSAGSDSASYGVWEGLAR